MPFETTPQCGYLLIKLMGICRGNETPSLFEESRRILENIGAKYIVIQCSGCEELHPSLLNELVQLAQHLKNIDGGIRLIASNEKILDLIKSKALNRILINRLSLRGALVDFGLVKPKSFDMNFINPFMDSTRKVLRVQCFLDAKPLKPYLKKPSDPPLLGDISGIISIVSEPLLGTLALSMPEKIFCKIATNMLGKEYTAINEEIVDLVGELANIILGQAKVDLNKIGYKLHSALPSCIWGRDHKIKQFTAGNCVIIPFETPEGTFYSEITTNNQFPANLTSNSVDSPDGDRDAA